MLYYHNNTKVFPVNLNKDIWLWVQMPASEAPLQSGIACFSEKPTYPYCSINIVQA